MPLPSMESGLSISTSEERKNIIIIQNQNSKKKKNKTYHETEDQGFHASKKRATTPWQQNGLPLKQHAWVGAGFLNPKP